VLKRDAEIAETPQQHRVMFVIAPKTPVFNFTLAASSGKRSFVALELFDFL